MKSIKLTVSEENAGLRLDVVLARELNISRTAVKKKIADGDILINEEIAKASVKVAHNDNITVFDRPPKKLPLEPKKLDLDILYENKDLIVINKPVDLVVHPGAGQTGTTLVHALLHHCKDLSGIGGVERPGIVHRLDKDTSGVIIVAKNDKAHILLSQQFKSRVVKKKYLALIVGTLRSETGKIESYIGRHPKYRHKMHSFPEPPENIPARHSVSYYKVLGTVDNKSLVEVEPHTGRTHQIRVHLSSIGHPIIGDPLYGSKQGKRQLLHAYSLSFIHPSTGEKMTFTTPLPGWAVAFVKGSAGAGY